MFLLIIHDLGRQLIVRGAGEFLEVLNHLNSLIYPGSGRLSFVGHFIPEEQRSANIGSNTLLMIEEGANT